MQSTLHSSTNYLSQIRPSLFSSERDHFRIGTDEGTHHMPPLLSVRLFDCVRKCLIEGRQHSSIHSFVSTHDPTQWPHFSSSSAPALCSLHLSLRGTPPASPSRRILLCWTLCHKDQQYSSARSFVLAHDPMRWPRFPGSSAPALCLLHFSLRGIPLASPSHRVLLCWTLCHKDQQHHSAHSFVLAYNPMRWPRSPHDSAPALSSLQSCLRATTTCLAFAQCSALSQTLLVSTPTLPCLLCYSMQHDAAPTYSTRQCIGAQHHTTFSPPGEPLLTSFEQNSTLFIGPQYSSVNSPEFVAPLTTTHLLSLVPPGPHHSPTT
jgi:hypothetical protein